MSTNNIAKVIEYFGGRTKVAKITGVSYMAVKKWEQKGSFPRTEYTGETTYAKKLHQASHGALSIDEMLFKDA